MEKKWLLYILQCKDGTLYTGITNDLTHRLEAHNSGKGAKYTRGRGPVKLCFVEYCENRAAALRREYQVKQMTTAEKWALCEESGNAGVN